MSSARGTAWRTAVCGKLIVAVHPQQQAALEALRARGEANVVAGLRLISRAEAQRLEPQLQCVSALLSESTGIVDSHGLMTALLGRAEQHGAVLALNTRFIAAMRLNGGWRVRLADGLHAPARHVRFSYATTRSRLEEGVAGIAAFLGR